MLVKGDRIDWNEIDVEFKTHMANGSQTRSAFSIQQEFWESMGGFSSFFTLINKKLYRNDQFDVPVLLEDILAREMPIKAKLTKEQLDVDWKTHWDSHPPNEDLMDWFEKYWIDHGGHELYFDVDPKNPNNWTPKIEENKVKDESNNSDEQLIDWIKLGKKQKDHREGCPTSMSQDAWDLKFWKALGGIDLYFTEEPATGRLLNNKYVGVPIEIIGATKPDPKLFVSRVEYNLAIHELTEAIRFTAEYTMQETLPPLPGWDWYDALVKYAPEKAAAFKESYVPPKSPVNDIPQTSGLIEMLTEAGYDVRVDESLYLRGMGPLTGPLSGPPPMVDLALEVVQGKGFEGVDLQEIKDYVTTLAKESKTPERAPQERTVQRITFNTAQRRHTRHLGLDPKVVHCERSATGKWLSVWVECDYGEAIFAKTYTPFAFFRDEEVIPTGSQHIHSFRSLTNQLNHFYMGETKEPDDQFWRDSEIPD